MASTFTTGFGIEKIGSGEQDGTWGTTTNHNLDILDRIASYKAVAITTNADTATLTVREASPGSGTENLQDGMYRVIKFTGALDSTCTITIAPNTAPAWFIIENATSGSQSLILSQGSGANVTVQNGKNAIIYCDGAGSGAAVVNALSDLQIATLEVTGAAAIDGALTAAAIAATTVTTSGIVSVDDTTTSTSGTTGSIHTDGGLGVAGTAFVAGAATVGGASQFNSTVTVGVNDTGYDVQFFGATSGAHMLWDESADDLKLVGAAGLTVAGNIDVDGTTNLDAVDIDGAVQIDATVTVGVDDTGYDVKFFGATSGAHMLWDESADDLKLVGAAGLTVAGNIDVDGTTNLDAVDIDGAAQIDATLSVGVDDTGYDVKFFGATSGSHMLWDESADDLKLVGAAGLTVAGDIDVDGTTNLDAVDIDGAVQIDATLSVGVDDTGYDVKFFGATASRYLLWDESADSLLFSDNAKAVFGDGSDLQIYHENVGNTGQIQESGAGGLYIKSDGALIALQKTGGEQMANFNTDGSVQLYYDNALKLATSADGVTVTGSLTLGTDLAVAQGGTGASTFAANGVLYGAGTGAIAATAVGTDGHILTSNGSGSAPTFQAAPAAATDWEVISSTGSVSAGTYLEITGFDMVRVQTVHTAGGTAVSHGLDLSTSGSSVAGVSTQNGQFWRMSGANTPVNATGSHSPSTSAMYYGSNDTSAEAFNTELNLYGLGETNVGIMAQQMALSSNALNRWTGQTASGSSTWFLYFEHACDTTLVVGCK